MKKTHSVIITSIILMTMISSINLLLIDINNNAKRKEVISSYRQQIYKDKKENVKAIVDITSYMLKTDNLIYDNDEIAFINNIKSRLYNLHFYNDKSGYIFVIHNNVVLNEEKILLNEKDSKGTYYIKSMLRAAEVGGGYLNYDYFDPYTKKYGSKISFVNNLGINNIIIGTGIYIIDIENQIKELDNFIMKISDDLLYSILIYNLVFIIFNTCAFYYILKIDIKCDE